MMLQIDSEKLLHVFQLLADLERKMEESDEQGELYERTSMMVTNLNVFLVDAGVYEGS